MMQKVPLRPDGLVRSPASTHVAVVPSPVLERVVGSAVPGALVESGAVAAVQP